MDGAAILERLRARLGSAFFETHAQCGDHTAVIERAALPGALSLCRDDAELAFDVLMDLTAVDYQKYPGREDGPRFEVVYHLYSLRWNHRLRIKVGVHQDDAVEPTARPHWPNANCPEGEDGGMLSVRVDAHP